jgi:hypothetical protein
MANKRRTRSHQGVTMNNENNIVDDMLNDSIAPPPAKRARRSMLYRNSSRNKTNILLDTSDTCESDHIDNGNGSTSNKIEKNIKSCE